MTPSSWWNKAKGWRVIGSYADVDPKLCVALYFTSTQLASTKPDLVKRFTEAMKESLAYADAHPDEIRAVLSSYTQITGDTSNRGIDCGPWPPGAMSARPATEEQPPE